MMVPITQAATEISIKRSILAAAVTKGLISSQQHDKEKHHLIIPLEEALIYAKLTTGQRTRLRKRGHTVRDLLTGQVTIEDLYNDRYKTKGFHKKKDHWGTMPPELRLIAAIFAQAKRDLHNKDPLIRQDARQFLASDNTWDFVEQAGIEICSEWRETWQ